MRRCYVLVKPDTTIAEFQMLITYELPHALIAKLLNNGSTPLSVRCAAFRVHDCGHVKHQLIAGAVRWVEHAPLATWRMAVFSIHATTSVMCSTINGACKVVSCNVVSVPCTCL